MSSDALLAELMGMAGLTDTETNKSTETSATPAEPAEDEVVACLAAVAEQNRNEGLAEPDDEPEHEDSGDFIEARLAETPSSKGGTPKTACIIADGPGEYFFNLETMRIVEHDGSDTISKEAYAAGTPVSDLVDLVSALRTIRKFLS